MPFTLNMTQSANVDDSLVKEFDQQFIVAAAEQGIMNQMVSYKRAISAEDLKLPKYSQLALAETPLDEDEDVTSEALVDAPILFTPAEYGNVVTRTNLASLQTGGTVDRAAARLVGENMGRSYDRLAVLAAEASTNELFGGTAASEAALAATDVMDTTLLNKIYNKLRRQKVPFFSNGLYAAVLHSDQVYDLKNSVGAGSWQDINKYARPEDVLRGAVGVLGGFMIMEDNHISINADVSGTVDSYHGLFMGFNALGLVESQPGQMAITGPFDKLGRFLNVGWKGTFQYKIVDQDAMYLGTTASSVGANS